MGIPTWRYRIGESILEKRVLMPHAQNTVHVVWHLLSAPNPLRLELRPSLHFRPQESPVNEVFGGAYALTIQEDEYTFAGRGDPFPPLRMLICGGTKKSFDVDRRRTENIYFRTEADRGYPSVGAHWSPGAFSMEIEPGGRATLVASTENWEVIRCLTPDAALASERERRLRLLRSAHPLAQVGLGAELVMAADQFVTIPAGRADDTARARAAGDEVRSVIAGYHWFTSWGRDTMICLEGLTLTTGRQWEARCILRTFAHHVRDGLVPNMFPEHEKGGLYHTADATLWFFHALHRYLEATGDRITLRAILPRLVDIVTHHLKGTRFGIRVDPSDGLLVQGEEGYQLTWMDAKVEGWVVTPRRGKAVEINALWYNALRLLEGWVREEIGEDEASVYARHAERAYRSFNERFWYEGGYLFDVVDQEGGGDDSACRPNQILAVSLDWPVLEAARWAPVVQVVQDRLLTPVGLRSLAPGHPDYKPQYFGDLRARDAAYHQGTVWAWLIGPFVDAWLKVHPNREKDARAFLAGFEAHLAEGCVGSIAEIFDATAPYTPRGCVAQAWSVAEVLRCWVKTGGSGAV
jgi:predicted glycogen debranching enzyme